MSRKFASSPKSLCRDQPLSSVLLCLFRKGCCTRRAIFCNYMVEIQCKPEQRTLARGICQRNRPLDPRSN